MGSLHATRVYTVKALMLQLLLCSKVALTCANRWTWHQCNTSWWGRQKSCCWVELTCMMVQLLQMLLLLLLHWATQEQLVSLLLLLLSRSPMWQAANHCRSVHVINRWRGEVPWLLLWYDHHAMVLLLAVAKARWRRDVQCWWTHMLRQNLVV